MFERFTDGGRQVVVVAHEEARRLQHNYIGTEHLLLGLLGVEDGLAASSLRSLGVTAERVRAQVIGIVGRGEELNPGQIPFTPRAKKVLEQSLREAQGMGGPIGTEHILLGLTREREGVATRILIDLDADPQTVRDEVTGLLSGAGERLHKPAPSLTDWFEGLSAHLERLGAEIAAGLGRDPDSGDLLLALACTEETLAGQVLRELKIDPDALASAAQRLREARLRATQEFDRQAGDARQAMERAIKAGDFEQAAHLRDRLREISAQPRAARLVGPEALDELRRRIGLSENP